MEKYTKQNYINNIDIIIPHHDTCCSSKLFWQIVGRFMMKSNTSVDIAPGDNKFTFWNQENAGYFFIFMSDIENANTRLLSLYNWTNTELSQIRVSESEVVDISSTLKVHKGTAGPDGTSNRMLNYDTRKSIGKLLIKPLVNLSLEQRVYPSLWKTASVMLLFKKKNNNNK